MDAVKLARGLGWFSMGLGIFEAAAPEVLGEWLGMEERAGLLRAYGAREIGSGAGLLSQSELAPWIWSRVAGDALDLVTLSAGLSPENPNRDNVVLAIVSVAGVTALDVLCAQQLSQDADGQDASR